jgi:ribonucleoside-diphosphate reductase alpha chain
MFYTSITQVKKRSGDIVPFDADKIFIAISKAYTAVKDTANDPVVTNVTQAVLNSLSQQFGDKTPSVEEVQNVVEKELMAQGLFDVAKDYIIYRYEHAKVREEKKIETLHKIEQQGLAITKRSGQKELFSDDKLRASLQKVIVGYEKDIDLEGVINQVRLEVFEDMTTSDLERAVIMVLRSFIELDPAYSYVASRLLLNRSYKQVIGHDVIDFDNLDNQLKHQLKISIQKGVAIGKLDPRMLLYNIDVLAEALKRDRDNLISYLSAQTLIDRYFIMNPVNKDLLEVPQLFWMRVAMGLALNEKNREERAIEFYSVISTLHFVPSTPTLFHAGTAHPQLSSCYLSTVEDSLDHIFKSIGDNAQLSKWSGGIGNDWTYLRGTGALIKGTGVESQGVIPFLKVANDTTVAINRSGKRRGATCAYLETWHVDIEDFLELRKNTGDERRRTHDMNTANWVPDLFMKRVKEDGMWTLFSPDETPDLHDLYGRAFEKRFEQYEAMADAGAIRLFKRMPAKDLWKKMLTMLFETGHPWVTFKDPSNIRSPQDHAGVVHSSNLCTEITLNTSKDEIAVCNLGSVNLGRHINNGELDMARLQFTVTTAMRMLDNVIDLNFYPTPEAKNSNMRHRPVGMGIMGFHDALYKQKINFDSEAMIDFADRSMEAVSYYALLASSQLAKERGVYPSYRGSKWDRGLLPVDTLDLLEQERGMEIPVPRGGSMDWTPVRQSIADYGMRNSNCLAIAPTATIANISSSIPSIEPIYKNIYVKSNQSGDFTVVNDYLVQALKERNLWNPQMLSLLKYHDGNLGEMSDIPQDLKDQFKDVFQVDPRWLIRAAAYRGKWIDQSQSLNIFYAGKSGKEINDIYIYAWDMGLKTTYYLRTMAASQVEKSTVNTAEFGQTHNRRKDDPKPVLAQPLPESQPVMAAMPSTPSMAASSTSSFTATAAAVQTQPVMTTTAVAEPEVKNEPMIMKVEPTPLSAGLGPMAIAGVGETTTEFKLCRLDDPDCEACQ